MKTKIFDSIIVLIAIFVLIELLIKKSLIYSSIMYALNLWVNNLIPSLFPFFIISDILINYNITKYIPKIIRHFCKYLFNITDNMLSILLLSMISGFPSNARNTRSLYDKGLITIDEANHILIFSHFANPIFILTTIAVFFLHNEDIGIIILISHYISNFILGILFRNKFIHNSNNANNNIILNNDFGNIFISSVKRAIDTILMICGIVVVFLMLSTIVVDTFNFNTYNEMLIKGFMNNTKVICSVVVTQEDTGWFIATDVATGVASQGKTYEEALSNLNINLCYKAVITSCILAFGGISVHMQVLSQITGTKIKYIYFFIGRMYQMIISGIVTYFICLILKI